MWEWCQDWYAEYPKGPVTDPPGPKQGQDRALRGGSWGSTAEKCRSAYRDYDHPFLRRSGVGFRVVLAPRSVAGEQEQSGARRAGSGGSEGRAEAEPAGPAVVA